MSKLARVAKFAVLVGIVCGAMAVWIAWQHNPQLALHDPSTGHVDWVYGAMIFTAWFVIAAAAAFAIGAAGRALLS
jgi:hypothetical protein